MANLYGRLRGYTLDGRPSSGEATRLGHGQIEADVETWDGKLSVHLKKDGSYYLYLGGKYDGGKLVARGNVDEQWLEIVDSSMVVKEEV